jgi:ribosomal protein L11 methyltransferase
MIEIRINLGGKKAVLLEEISAALENAGVKREEIAEEVRKGHTRLLVYVPSLGKAEKIRERLIKAGHANVNVSVNRLKDEDWKTAWKKFYKPFRIAGNVYIVPAWEKKFRGGPNARPVYIDTAMAFGTGLHPTTRMVAAFANGLSGRFKRAIDVGTGSGILAVVAAKCGAEEIAAFDNDAEAVRTARKNLLLNGCGGFSVFEGDICGLKRKGVYDLVLANLVTDVLVENKKALASLVAPGGHLAVSGIYEDNYPFFRKRFKDKSLRVSRVAKNKKWRAVLFRKALRNR